MFRLFKRRADPAALDQAGIKAGKLLDESLKLFCSLQDIKSITVDEAIRKVTEAQMMVVSLSTSLFNYTLTDAYYDAGLADPLAGMPKIKLNHQDSRTALRRAWSGFPTARMNLDARYRYIFAEKLLSPPEQELWAQMEQWSEQQAKWHFEMRQQLSTDWAAVVMAIAEGDVGEARRILREG